VEPEISVERSRSGHDRLEGKIRRSLHAKNGKQTPMQRNGTGKKSQGCVSRDRTQFITGQVLAVDGGTGL